ncbi:uncharacterized protein [Lolium perenne]|uniref:uncharacterized protein n=1 Tax=Lolium perenne TaxID=4522 RepID=UPI003A994035
MSSGDDFDLSDSSSSDDSDLEELLQDDDLESTILLLAVKDPEDRAKLLNRRRGSVFGWNHIQRNRLLGHEQLMEDYFAEVPTYPAHLFRRRYRMRRSLFVRIVKACELHSNYFKQRRNAAGVMGFSAFQKIFAAMRVIAYGIPADYTDEYLRIGENTTTESVRRSPLFAKLANGEAPTCNYKVMNNEYSMGYYLADGIYPDWETFVKSVKDPQDRIEAEFAKAQELARKDIERAFGVLQARFAIVRGHARFWDKKTLINIMTCCVIFHNTIIEDERDLSLPCFFDNVGTRVEPQRNPDRIEAFLETHRQIDNASTHIQLVYDLKMHHWQRHGRHL